ncbi:MAG: hypothetical protein ACO35C_07660 [Pontimonas sp.]
MMNMDEATKLGLARNGVLKISKVLDERGELRRDVLERLFRLRRDNRVVPTLNILRDFKRKMNSRENCRLLELEALDEWIETLVAYPSVDSQSEDLELAMQAQKLISDDREKDHRAKLEIEWLENTFWESVRCRCHETLEELVEGIKAVDEECVSRNIECVGALGRLFSRRRG